MVCRWANDVQDLDFDALTAILSGFQKQGGRYVTFSGGEPGLRADLPELILKATALGLSVTLYTNGLASNENVLDSLQRASVLLAISLDGPSADIHEAMRGSGTFAHTLNRLKKAVAHIGGHKVMLSCILSRPLLSHVEQLWEFVQLHGVRWLYLNLFESPQGSIRDPRAPSTPELIKPILWLLEAADQQNTIRLLFSESHDLITARYVFSGAESTIVGRTVKVQADGWAFPGPFFYHPRFRLGRPLEQGWIPVLNSSRYQELREQARTRVQHVPECRQCFWSYRCGGGSLALTWAFYQKWAAPCPLCELYRATLNRAARRQVSNETPAYS